jgi:hypothetical protein
MSSEVRLHLSEAGAEAERVDALTRYLRAELLALDVRDVTGLPVGEPPAGARSLDVVAVGGLIVTLGQSAASLVGVVSTVRAWLSRGGSARRTVRIEIGGDVLELSEVTAAEQDRLVELFVSRHSTDEG